MKKVALTLGILVGILAAIVATTLFEPESAAVTARVFVIVAAALSFLLIRIGNSGRER